MSKILLINSNRFKQPWPVIPFGLTSVAAALEHPGREVNVLDLCFSMDCAGDIEKAVSEVRPDVIGISIRNIDNASPYNAVFLLGQVRDEVIAPCKKAFKGPIVIGGPAVGISGREMLDFFDLAYAIRGDGELAMVEFVERLRQKRSPYGMKGLIIREKGRITQDLPTFYARDINLLPLPKPHKYIDIRKYHRFDSPLQVQTKRGCALNCAYCTYNRIEGRRYRFRDPKLIADYIETLVKETGINHIEFTDSAFNVPLPHAKEVLREIIKRRLDLRLRTMGLNPSAVDKELVGLMKQAGFTDVDLGAESGCDKTLKGLGKNYMREDVLKAGRLLGEARIPVMWYLLVGAPGETTETLKETFDTISKAARPWDLVNIGVGIRVYKDAPIAKDMIREEISSRAAKLVTSEKGFIEVGARKGASAAAHLADKDFFFPIAFQDKETLNLKTIKEITKEESLRHPNFFMYDEDENTPGYVLMFGVMILRLLRLRQPVWKLWILQRKIRMLLKI